MRKDKYPPIFTLLAPNVHLNFRTTSKVLCRRKKEQLATHTRAAAAKAKCGARAHCSINVEILLEYGHTTQLKRNDETRGQGTHFREKVRRFSNLVESKKKQTQANYSIRNNKLVIKNCVFEFDFTNKYTIELIVRILYITSFRKIVPAFDNSILSNSVEGFN